MAMPQEARDVMNRGADAAEELKRILSMDTPTKEEIMGVVATLRGVAADTRRPPANG